MACTLEKTTFIWGNMQRNIKDGLSILLPASDTLQLFGENCKLSRIAAAPQAYPHLYLNLNLSEKLYVGTPSFHNTTDREAAQESLQFGTPPVSRRWSGRQTRPRVRTRCISCMSQMRTTAALLRRCRWANLHTSSHRHQGTRAELSISTLSCLWGGWIHSSFSVCFRKLW